MRLRKYPLNPTRGILTDSARASPQGSDLYQTWKAWVECVVVCKRAWQLIETPGSSHWVLGESHFMNSGSSSHSLGTAMRSQSDTRMGLSSGTSDGPSPLHRSCEEASCCLTLNSFWEETRYRLKRSAKKLTSASRTGDTAWCAAAVRGNSTMGSNALPVSTRWYG